MNPTSEHTIKHQGAMDDSTMENAILHFSTINHATSERKKYTINYHTDFLAINNYTTNNQTTDTIYEDISPKHFEFDDMITDNETGRTMLKKKIGGCTFPTCRGIKILKRSIAEFLSFLLILKLKMILCT